MDRLIEHDIIQNIGIGALALNEFTRAFFEKNEKLEGPSLAVLMPILPLLFHEKTLNSIYKRRISGGFFSALTSFHALPAGLQGRMVDMSDQTFESLSLAFNKGLLTYKPELNEIIPLDLKKSNIHYDEDIRKIMKGAKRLGSWFAGLTFEQVCINLKIKF